MDERVVVRRLIGSTLVNTLGDGVYAAVGALFLIRVAGLSVAEVGTGLTIAAVTGLVASTPLGVLADRLGPNRTYAFMLLVQAIAFAALTQVRTPLAYVAVVSVIALAEAGGRGAEGALIAGAVEAGTRVRTRAVLRVATNIGMSMGIGIGGVVLLVDRPDVYILALLGNAATYLGLAVTVMRGLPRVPPVPSASGPSALSALRDRPFLAFVALDGLLTMHNVLAQVAIPLWVVTATDAPAWLVSVLLLVNTAVVIVLQVRMTRGTEQLAGAARAGRRAGWLLAATCLVLAITDVTSGTLTVSLLVVAALAHVFGEMFQAAGSWGVTFELAPPDAHGQYQGAAAMGRQFGDLLGPMVLTVAAVGSGWPGWLATAALFLVAGVLVPVAVRRHERAGLRGQPSMEPG
jgi:MFS family permease